MRHEEELGKLLRERGKTIAVAESVTGGLVSDLMTNVPGSSYYFLAGMVTYSNESKIKLLGVKRSILERHGAVSEQVALEMASGVRERVGADIGAAVTGIAGPAGGMPGKPAGLAFFAVDDGNRIVVDRAIFEGNRLQVKRYSADHLIGMIINEMK
jgi:nicotinamide-nucleotide amidase